MLIRTRRPPWVQSAFHQRLQPFVRGAARTDFRQPAWRPELRQLGEREAGRHHADHRVGNPVQPDLPPQHVGICREVAPPQAVAQDDDVIMARGRFLPEKRAAERRKWPALIARPNG